MTAKIDGATPYIEADLIDPFENPDPGLLTAKGHIDRYRVNLLFDTECLGNILTLEFCKRVGIKYRVKTKTKYMSVMANQTLQETVETIEHVTLSLRFYIERMKFIIPPSRYDVMLRNNWKNKQKATIVCSNNHVHFNHAGHQYIIDAKKTLK